MSELDSRHIHLQQLSSGQHWRKLVPYNSSDQASVVYTEDIVRIYHLQ